MLPSLILTLCIVPLLASCGRSTPAAEVEKASQTPGTTPARTVSKAEVVSSEKVGPAPAHVSSAEANAFGKDLEAKLAVCAPKAVAAMFDDMYLLNAASKGLAFKNRDHLNFLAGAINQRSIGRRLCRMGTFTFLGADSNGESARALFRILERGRLNYFTLTFDRGKKGKTLRAFDGYNSVLGKSLVETYRDAFSIGIQEGVLALPDHLGLSIPEDVHMQQLVEQGLYTEALTFFEEQATAQRSSQPLFLLALAASFSSQSDAETSALVERYLSLKHETTSLALAKLHGYYIRENWAAMSDVIGELEAQIRDSHLKELRAALAQKSANTISDMQFGLLR